MEDSEKEERTAVRQMRNDVIEDTGMGEIKMRANTVQRETRYGRFEFLLYLPEHERESWEEEVKKQKTDRSALIRAYAAVGRKFLQKHRPIEKTSSEPETVEELIKRNVPTESTSAKNINDIIDAVGKDLEQILLRTLAGDERIQQSGEQFYRTQ